jgi:hypothetical protein
VQQQPYEDLVELAKVCIRQARACTLPEAATKLRRMAKEYQERAATLDGGKLPDLAED